MKRSWKYHLFREQVVWTPPSVDSKGFQYPLRSQRGATSFEGPLAHNPSQRSVTHLRRPCPAHAPRSARPNTPTRHEPRPPSAPPSRGHPLAAVPHPYRRLHPRDRPPWPPLGRGWHRAPPPRHPLRPPSRRSPSEAVPPPRGSPPSGAAASPTRRSPSRVAPPPIVVSALASAPSHARFEWPPRIPSPSPPKSPRGSTFAGLSVSPATSARPRSSHPRKRESSLTANPFGLPRGRPPWLPSGPRAMSAPPLGPPRRVNSGSGSPPSSERSISGSGSPASASSPLAAVLLEPL